MFKYGVLDYAGGMVIHVSSGVSALVLTYLLGGKASHTHVPHNVPFVLLGAGLLWFGWMGFNGKWHGSSRGRLYGPARHRNRH